MGWTDNLFIVDLFADSEMRMARIRHYKYTDIVAKEVVMEDVEGAKMRMVIGPLTGAPNFYMRIFELEPRGHTPYHSHDWEHENFIMDGKGEVVKEDGTIEELVEGDIVFVPPNVMHQYRNVGDQVFRFICLVPK